MNLFSKKKPLDDKRRESTQVDKLQKANKTVHADVLVAVEQRRERANGSVGRSTLTHETIEKLMGLFN